MASWLLLIFPDGGIKMKIKLWIDDAVGVQNMRVIIQRNDWTEVR